MNSLEWHKFPDEPPPHNADVLALTKGGELVRSRFMCIAYVERQFNSYGSPYHEYAFKIIENSDIKPIFVPINALKGYEFNDFHQDISHWCHLPNLPCTSE